MCSLSAKYFSKVIQCYEKILYFVHKINKIFSRKSINESKTKFLIDLKSFIIY